jgi:UDP-glucose 4-epimerase
VSCSPRLAGMPIKERAFLVTGGSGFIGSHVVDELVAEDVGRVVVFDSVIRTRNLERSLASGRVEALEGDLLHRASLARAMKGVDGVFHLAVLPLGPCAEDPRACLDVNVVGSFNVFEAAHRAGVEKIVFSSASSVYGDTHDVMDESHPLEARTMYGATKISAEFFLRAFHQMYGLDYVTLRYMNVYGPRQQGGLIMSVLQRIRSGSPPMIEGDGSQSFDFLHVADVASANVRAMESKVTDEAFNVGSGTEATVRDVVDLLLHLTGSELEPVLNSDSPVLMTRRVGSRVKAQRLLGWEPSRDLETGLRDVLAWEENSAVTESVRR